MTGRKMCKPVFPAKMNNEDNMGTVISSRMQLPLILSYALTVHRAQGMTLDTVVCNLQGLFAKGQLKYTALSRVRNFDKLRVIGSVKSDAACANQKVWRLKQAQCGKPLTLGRMQRRKTLRR